MLLIGKQTVKVTGFRQGERKQPAVTPELLSILRIRSASPLNVLFCPAEDGIRAATVTGVQTCALPILPEYLGRIVALAAVTAGPGTVAAGAVLPALWAAFGDRRSVARPVGELTAANLVGGVVGALAAAFVILPSIGLRSGFLVAGVAYLVLAQAIGGRDAGVRPVAYASLLAIVILDPMHAPLAHLNPGETLRATAEGASGILTVVDTGDDLQLRLDNYYVLGGSAAEPNERRQGLVPLLLHPDPHRVAFIGMATGISASAAA